MYGTYWGFSLPLSTLAALVASGPSVWPLASTTYHLRSIFLPLGTNVDISLPPANQSGNPALPSADFPAFQPRHTPTKTAAQSAPARNVHTGLNLCPTAKQCCSRENRGCLP